MKVQTPTHLFKAVALAAILLSSAAHAQTYSYGFSGSTPPGLTFAAGSAVTTGGVLNLDNSSDTPTLTFSLASLSDVSLSFIYGASNSNGTPVPRFTLTNTAGFNLPNTTNPTTQLNGNYSNTFTNLTAGNYVLGFLRGQGDDLRIDNVSITVSAVPEPQAYALMFAGLGALGFVARRRQMKK